VKLIVGLGNPRIEYIRSRHNVGFMILDNVIKELNIDNSRIKKDGLYFEGIYNETKFILLKPQKSINLSGEVIKKFIDFYKINIEDVLIISDDLDIKLGNIKLKQDGGSGGHNGLKNIEIHLNTKKYKRLKIGISNDKSTLTREYVLSNFKNGEILVINNVIKTATKVVIDFLSMDFVQMMNKYNKR